MANEVLRALQGFGGTLERGLTNIGAGRRQDARQAYEQAKFEKFEQPVLEENVRQIQLKREQEMQPAYIPDITADLPLSWKIWSTKLIPKIAKVFGDNVEYKDGYFMRNGKPITMGEFERSGPVIGGMVGSLTDGKRFLEEAAGREGMEGVEGPGGAIQALAEANRDPLAYERRQLAAKQELYNKFSGLLGKEGRTHMKGGLDFTQKRLLQLEKAVLGRKEPKLYATEKGFLPAEKAVGKKKAFRPVKPPKPKARKRTEMEKTDLKRYQSIRNDYLKKAEFTNYTKEQFNEATKYLEWYDKATDVEKDARYRKKVIKPSPSDVATQELYEMYREQGFSPEDAHQRAISPNPEKSPKVRGQIPKR